ncbi:hypothetical protein ScPMuIL_016810 [Solemya velum]
MIRGMLRIKCADALWLGWTCVRGQATTVDKSSLSKLRKKTGFSFINCKKALEQFSNDLEQSEKWLREQAQKEGWTKASKLQGRPMSSGLVGIVANNKRVTMVEVNCETDFVARNEKFQNLVSSLVAACDKNFTQGNQSKSHLSTSDLAGLATSDGKTLGDLVALEVGSIGENMLLRRAVCFTGSEDSLLATYIHSSGPDMIKEGCSMGKFGAVVEVQQTSSESEEAMSLVESARQLCQHIVGMNPKTIGKPDDEPLENKDEETKLIFQEFLLDPDLTVQDFMRNNGVAVKDFLRYECGEELAEQKDQ